MEKKLMKSETDKMVCGICGGIAEYIGVDSTLVRLGVAAACLIGGMGILPYIIAAIVIPGRN